MATMQLQIMSGPTKGRRPAFEQGTVRFGREHDNDVQIGGAHVSRHHGDFVYEDGQWLVVNHSANGTLINGRVVKKPTPLASGDIISIGDEQMFRIVIQADQGPADEDDGDEAAPESAAAKGTARLSSKTKLYVGLAAWWLVMLGLGAAFLSLRSDEADLSISNIPQLTDEQIEREIRTLPEVRDLLPAQAAENLTEARLIAERTDSAPDALYRAHRHYQLALAYSGRTTYENNIDTLRADEIRRDLIEKVTALYRTGYAQARSRQYREAIETFEKLTSAYPAPGSEICDNVEQQRAFANKQLGRRR